MVLNVDKPAMSLYSDEESDVGHDHPTTTDERFVYQAGHKFFLGIYVALICGPSAGKHFMNGESIHPQTETMAQIHEIRNITPGAIATCSVLARWALSNDDTVREVGSTTGIRFFNDFEEYLTILETSLCQKKKSVINVIKQWDEKIFPDSDSSLVTGKKNEESSSLKKAMDLLAADSDEDDQPIAA